MKRSIMDGNCVFAQYRVGWTMARMWAIASAVLLIGILGCGHLEDTPRVQFARIKGSFDHDDRDPLGSGYRVQLGNTLFTDRDMEGPYLQLLAAHEIIEIDLLGTKVTDAGLEELKAFRNLRTLSLVGTKITDAGMPKIAELKSLRSLALGGTHLGGTSLNYLASLPNLEELDLTGTKVTDTAMHNIRGLRQLRSLRIALTAVSDSGLEYISELTQLQTLAVGPMVTDAGIEHIARLKELVGLTVYSGEITDAGVERLESLPKLKRLVLRGANVTCDTLERLRQAHPDLRIHWEYGPEHPRQTVAGENIVTEIERLGGSVKVDAATSDKRAFSVRLAGSAAERAELFPALGQIGCVAELHLCGRLPMPI